MEADEQVAQMKKEKAEVERQLEVALRRIVELEEQLKRQEESWQERLTAERESEHRTDGRNAEPNRGDQKTDREE